MKTRMFALASTAAVLAGAAQLAAASRVVGVIAGVESQPAVTLQITSKGAEPSTVRTDDKTAFLKWVTHKPWQGGDRVSASALMQGRCVEVELSESGVAKVVYVSDEPAGSVFDPCRSRR